jgi:hypothetical protein
MKPTIALIALCLPSLAAADKKLHPWARFAAGAWVKFESGTATIKLTTHQTLVSVGEHDFVLHDRMSGIATREEKKAHPMAELAPAADPGAATKEGSEAIVVGGKSYACETWSWSGETTTGPASIKEWRAAGVALPLKRVVTHTLMGLEQVDQMTAVKLDEKMAAAGTMFKTVRYEGQSLVGKSPPVPFTRWSSLDIPGGVVKETRYKNGAAFSNTTVLGFGLK